MPILNENCKNDTFLFCLKSSKLLQKKKKCYQTDFWENFLLKSLIIQQNWTFCIKFEKMKFFAQNLVQK